MLAGCGDDIEPGRTEPDVAVIKGLTTGLGRPLPGALPRSLNGTVEALDQSRLTARLPGRVEQILVHEGQTARAGQTILTLDQQTATDELAAAQAAAEAAAGSLAEAEAHQELAASTLQRYLQLREGGAVTSQELDQIRNRHETARQKSRSARADLARAQAGLKAARVMADQVRIAAPFDARINRLLVDIGSTVMPGTALVQLDRLGPWLVSLEVPQSLAGNFLPDKTFDIEIPPRQQQYKAVLAELFPAANPVTRTLTVKLRLEEEAAELKSGMFARVFVPATGSASLFVPTSALVTRGQLTALYVVVDDILHYRLVRTGNTLDGQTEILAGLSPDETIVIEGATRARHGARLENP